MFTKNNRQLQSTAKAEINNDNQNNRKAGVFINKLFARGRAFLFVAAIAFSFMAASASSAQAQQQNNYWATDGCYYSHNGVKWTRYCPADQSRTKYFFDLEVNGQWQRILYMDSILYSENGLTFKTNYVYSIFAWTRSYSNGLTLIFSERRREWMSVEDYLEYGNQNNATRADLLKAKQVLADTYQQGIRNTLEPTCGYGYYNRCR